MIVVVNLLGLGHVDYPFNHEILIYEIQNISQIEKNLCTGTKQTTDIKTNIELFYKKVK